MPPIIQTARWAAAQRARESERQDRLFFDPLAAALAGEEGRAALQLSEKYNPRHEDTANYICIRIRFFDDVAQDGAGHGIRQIVLPAAGHGCAGLSTLLAERHGVLRTGSPGVAGHQRTNLGAPESCTKMQTSHDRH